MMKRGELKRKTGGNDAAARRLSNERELFRCAGFCSRCGNFLGFLLLLGNALESLLAGLCLFRIAASRTLGETGFVKETQNAVRRLRAVVDPMLDALGVQLDALFYCPLASIGFHAPTFSRKRPSRGLRASATTIW